MNKAFNSFLLLLSSSFLLASCNSGNNSSSSVVAEASLTLNQSALSLEAYESSTLTYTLTGKTGTPSWTSSDTSVATVDSSGKVTGVKAGSCTITVSLDELSATCEVTVTTISQAPRIVLGESSISLDKGNTYVIDAYTIYKNEIRDDSLEVSLKGSDTTIASATYANKKITISGLEYGQADFVVHANVLGVLITANLHVQVVNADIALKLGNITAKEGEYSLELGMFKADDDGLPTEFTPEVIFTDKEQPASYALTYTSSDDAIATWDGNHKILAKGVGEATLKITCEQFKLSVEIKVNVVKGAYDVVLKNINEAGESVTEKVGAHKAPKTVASVENKKFVGWFDEDGNKVTSIVEDITLYAHYSVEFEYSGNEILKKFTNNDSDYTQPAGTDWKYSARGSDAEGDVKNGFYPGVDGAQGFYYPDSMEKVAGLGLPSYDFSSSASVRFTFGFSDSAADIKVNDTAVGDCPSSSGGALDQKPFYNYVVTIRGKNMIVENKGKSVSTSITLDDDTYTGKKGLEIKATGVAWRWLFVTPFKSIDVDYISAANGIEKSLPDEPEAGDYLTTIETYKSLRALYGEGENSVFPISEKMQSWIDAYTVTTLTDYTNDQGVTIEGNLSADEATYKKLRDPSADLFGGCPAYDGDSKAFLAQINDLTASFASITFPAVDFSAYKTVTFSFGTAGNIGQYKDRYFFLGDAPSNMASATSAENYIGAASESINASWNTAGSITATIANGSITFNGATIDDKTFTLSDDIYKGNTGLKLSLGNICWEYLVVSPFFGHKI